jgi:hypothetical protein
MHWGMKHPHAAVENVSELPKVNMFCAVSSLKVNGPFFFVSFSFSWHLCSETPATTRRISSN